MGILLIIYFCKLTYFITESNSVFICYRGAVAKPAAPAKPTSAPAPGRGGKRPAWDLKGRLEDMEKMFSQTNARVTDLEVEKRELQTDVEVKKEVVVQNSEEIKDLRRKIGAYVFFILFIS